jgi:hypothetical protein
MFEYEENEGFGAYKKVPIYIKAVEITDLVDKIATFINESIDLNLEETELLMAKSYADDIVLNAQTIVAKIAGAESGELYDIKMENASLIRKAAREISTNCTGLKMFEIKGFDYLDLLREEMESFRVEFAEWVKSFDPWNYHVDRWGLFNPPGVNYDDHDPDDDLPFDRG